MSIDHARLQRCLAPKSIAVVGGDEALRVIKQCRKLGFAGDLFAVNKKRANMDGLICYRDIADLPVAPDAAFIAIPADASIAAVAEFSRLGAGGAVCYASGYKEVSGGESRQQKLRDAAGAMPVIGPNCYGFINLTCNAALWPDYHGAKPCASGVAIFSQSGNISLNLSMQRRHLPLAWLVTLGNQVMVGVEEGIAAALAEPRITAIGMHIEGVRDLPRFVKLAAEAREKGVPMVALKAGKSPTGARITFSHTATLAGESALYDALFARLGIGVVATPEEFIEALKLLAASGVMHGGRVSSMSCSGGEATLVADLSVARNINFPALSDAHRETVQATLNDYVRVDNPLDYHTFIWGDRARMTATYRAMMSADFDLTLLILDTPDDDREATAIWLCAVHAFIDACRASGRRGAVVSLLSENLPDEIAALLQAENIAPLQGIAQALTAVQVAREIGEAWSRDDALPVVASPVVNDKNITRLDEAEAKKLLATAGLPIPKSQIVTSSDDAIAAAEQIGYPVVIKVLAADLAHKTENDALALNLTDAEQVRHYAQKLLTHSGRVLVEAMVQGAVAELLLSVAYDQQFGHYFVLGFGGELVELIADRELLLPPLNARIIHDALSRLKTAKLLTGYRGRAVADVDAVVECALRLAKFLAHDASRIAEIEINPLMVKSQNKGVIVADALITLRGKNHE